ncbi:MAG: NTP transferase domain-containing protein [Thermoanaerobaculales bacterium]
MKNLHIAGLILAGGEGKRWGGPKAFAGLPDGRTFLEACTIVLRAAGAKPVVATLPPGTPDPGIEGLEGLALPEPGLDMFGSLCRGFGRLAELADWEAVVVLPVDHPLVQPVTVKALAAAGVEAVIPSFGGKHGHPVCLRRNVAESIVAGESEGPTLRDVLRAYEATDLVVDDPGVVANCNTAEALAAALDRLRERNY